MNLDPINPYWTDIVRKLQRENEELKEKLRSLEEREREKDEFVDRANN